MRTKKESFKRVFNKTEFKKFITYFLRNYGKVKKVNSLQSESIIFTVVSVPTDSNTHCFFNTDYCYVQSAFINQKGEIETTLSTRVNQLKYMLDCINFFERDEKSKEKMQFPDVKLLNK